MVTESQRNFDVIVVGLGAMGSCTVDHLARRGLRVLGLDQHAIPHSLGSSHGYSRMIRQAYFEHLDYVPLIIRSYENWYDLERRSGENLLNITSALYLGQPGGALVAGASRAAQEHLLPHELLTGADIRRRFPQFRLPAHFAAMVEPMAGYLRPEQAVAAACTQAMLHGAELHGHERVTHWEESGSHVRVRTERASYEAGHLVFTAGPWTQRLLSELSIPLTVTRQVLGWFWPRRPDLFRLGTFPCWSIEHEGGGIHYGFPMLPDNPGFKIANHNRGRSADPDHVDRLAHQDDVRDLHAAIMRHVPDAQGPLLAARICTYTNSPDGNFIIDRLPGTNHVFIACGFSGHGFKFATVIGEVLADLTQYGNTNLPIMFLRLGRLHTNNLEMAD